MKNNFVILLFILPVHSFCQGGVSTTADASNNNITTNAFIETYDKRGKPFASTYKQVMGTIFLNDNWGKGEVKFQNNFILKHTELQFDLFENTLHFRKDSIAYLFVDAIKSFKLEYKEGDDQRSVYFNSGYPAIDEKNNNSFFQVLADGKAVQLLKYSSKVIREKYSYLGSTTKEYESVIAYYVYDFVSKTIKSIKPGKDGLLKALPADYSNTINQFVTKKRYKLKNEQEMIELFNLLNE